MAYRSGGDRYEHCPLQQRVLYDCTPIYEDLAGWNEDISGIREFEDLPIEARRYVEYVEDAAGVPVELRPATLLPPLLRKARGIWDLDAPPPGTGGCKDCAAVSGLLEKLGG